MKAILFMKRAGVLFSVLFFLNLSLLFADSGSLAKSSDMLASEGKTEEALALLEAPLRQNPEDPILLTAKAHVFLYQKEFQKAEGLCRTVIGKYPSYDWPLKLLVRSLIDQRQYKESLLELARAESFLKEDYDLAILQGEALQGLRKYSEAEVAFNRAASIKGDDVNLYEIKAWNLRMMGKMEDSEKELQHALSLEPYNQRLLVVMSKHYRERRYYRKSLSYLEKAVEACGKSSCPEIHEIDLPHLVVPA